MREENRNEDKPSGREIRFSKTEASEKPHGKLYRWFDNFWYHHKWKTLIIAFFVIVFTVCIVQICQNDRTDGDVTVLYVGSKNLLADGDALRNLGACLGTYLPEDYNKNGEKKVNLTYYTVYSEEQIKRFEEHTDEKGDPAPIFVNRAENSAAYSQFNTYLMTGDASILLLEPWIFSEMEIKSRYMIDLAELLGYTPDGAQYIGGVCYGVRLGDTALYKNNLAMQALPADTVLCLMGPYFMGESSDEVKYTQRKDYFVALVKNGENGAE